MQKLTPASLTSSHYLKDLVPLALIFEALLRGYCVAGCTLHYQDLNLTAELPPNTRLTVCNSNWTYSFSLFNRVAKVTNSIRFKGLDISEEEAVVLQRLRRKFTTTGSPRMELYEFNCLPEGDVYHVNISIDAYWLEWGVSCANLSNTAATEGGPSKTVSGIYIGYLVKNDTQNFTKFLTELTEEIGDMLLSLTNLTSIQMKVYNGTLPPQLGALPNLKRLTIKHFCLSGSLPPQWISSLGSLENLQVTSAEEAAGNVDPYVAVCGVQGSIPETWFSKESNIIKMDLSNNALTGRSEYLHKHVEHCRVLRLDWVPQARSCLLPAITEY